MCRGCDWTLGLQTGCPPSVCEGPSRQGGTGQGEGTGLGVRPTLPVPGKEL